MSLEDFLNKKSKKKSKRTLNTKDLYEKIINTNPPPKVDTDKATEDSLPQVSVDNDEWEPIQNEIVPDIATLGLTDIVDEDEEDEVATSSNAKDTAKSRSNKVAWEKEPKIIEKEEPKKAGVYVPGAFKRAENLPNFDSLDDFPTLDAVKEKPKKAEPAEFIDNSWKDVHKSSAYRRKDEVNTVAPPTRSDGPNRYVPSGSRDGFSSRGGFSDRLGNSQPSSRPWTRGETIKSSAPVSTTASTEQKSGGFERRPGVAPSSKPYVPPSLRNHAPISQSNRYAQFDNS
ncbi:hypothetical protein Aperf_G00000030948 [Anoplocephala perfoliata]